MIDWLRQFFHRVTSVFRRDQLDHARIEQAELLRLDLDGVQERELTRDVLYAWQRNHEYVHRDMDGREVGLCTSGSPAPTVGKNIGLGYLPTAMAEIGKRFLVDCRGKNIEAVNPSPSNRCDTRRTDGRVDSRKRPGH